MSNYIVLPLIVSLLYAGTGAAKLWYGEYWWAVMWFSYTVANFALIKVM